MTKDDVAFQSYYSNIFKNRWHGLYNAMLEPVNTIALILPFFTLLDEDDESIKDEFIYMKTPLPWSYIPMPRLEVDIVKNHLTNRTIINHNGFISQLKDYIYYLDGASVFASFCLDVSPGDKVLDLCSAPGGKSLIIASNLFHKIGNNNSSNMSTNDLINKINLNNDKNNMFKDGLLVCNEVCRTRYERMVNNIKRFIPEKYISKNIQFTNYDGLDCSKFKRFGSFDKIMLDAPCTSERHVIQKSLQWNKKNIKEISKNQINLLKNAISMLKPNGIILYCTCALDFQENELVIHNILNEYKNIIHVPIIYEQVINDDSDHHIVDINMFKPEKRTFGCALMPDKSNFGPLYICKLKHI